GLCLLGCVVGGPVYWFVLRPTAKKESDDKAANEASDKTYTIKIKNEQQVGKSHTVQATDETVTSFKIFGPAGNVVNEDKKKEETFVESVLMKGDKRPFQYQRVYQKAVSSDGKNTMHLSYEGRTVLFQLVGDKYNVLVATPPPLAPKDLAALTKAVNRKDTDP